ncbi:hypothetical protein NL529_32200, partial [Klebsiella pneumoniae]|nr:hypothetical protein [Klebsiella pneumoniae]
IDHLDALGLVSIHYAGISTFKPLVEAWKGSMDGYFCVGFLNDRVDEARDRINACAPGLPVTLMDHELNPGFMRFAYPSSRIVR